MDFYQLTVPNIHKDFLPKISEQISKARMTDLEKVALSDYVSSSTGINRWVALRKRVVKPKQMTPIPNDKGYHYGPRFTSQEAAWHLINLSKRFRIPEEIVVFRGTADRRYIKGRTYSNPCFISTSLSLDIAKNFGTGSLIQFMIPEDHPIIYVPAVGSHHPGEFEVILPPKTKFKVIEKIPGVKIGNYARTEYQVKVLPYGS